ncbi:MAG TPA: MarR family transcriptional regulator [Bacillales bacterium]|nr:MarR family transcriptional regulator [Bacillales bacterium]
MKQLFELFLKSGLRPLSLFPEVSKLEELVNRSELASLLILDLYDEMTMSELADQLGFPLSTVTSLSKRLVRKGYVIRNHSNKDKRIILIRLTEKGQKIAIQAKEMIENLLACVYEALSDEELNQFIHLALKVVKALQENGPQELKQQNIQLRKISIDD